MTTTLPAESAAASRSYAPRFDIWEGPDALVLYGDLPGVRPEDLELQFEQGELSIVGKVWNRYEQSEFLRGEYGLGDFRRKFTVHEAIDVDSISATLKDGVLIVRLPRRESVKPRRIEVNAG